MALQSSGAISFANLQTEFGGSHPITMGEYSAYRVSGSGNTISMNQYYGAAGTLDTQTVTISTVTVRGYLSVGYKVAPHAIGSISDGTSNLYSGAAIRQLYWFDTNNRLHFSVAGTHANSGWTTMALNGTNYARTSASHTQSGGNTSWGWNSVTSNPFGATSGTKTVEWT